MINKNSRIPLYIQLADEIRDNIRQGKIKEGDKLESEAEMIKKYRMGRLTIREALGILVNEGLLEKRHGKGTFCKTNIQQRKHKVDVLLNLEDIYFIPYYMRSICNELEAENVHIVLSDTKNDTDVIANLLEGILRDGSSGVIFQPTNSTLTAPEKITELLKKLEDAKIPYVMVDTHYENSSPSYVIMDEFSTGKIACDYFVRMGHSNICVIVQENRIESAQRVEAFFNDLPKKPYVIQYDPDLKKSIKKMLSEEKDITGIFCYHDGIAKKCYEILFELGLKIPDDISIISVDDTIIASTLSPTLTSVIHAKEHLGKEAAKAILSMISGEKAFPYKKVFQPSLAVRKSCREI